MKMRLKYWRTRRAYSIRDLAERAKVSSSTIVEIEKTGDAPTRPSVIRKLAEALETTVDELLVVDTIPDETDQAEPESSLAA